MIALFDQNTNLVGWMVQDQHIFDVDMNWVAYISNNHAWSAETGNWLGSVVGLTCLDQDGRPLAWSPEAPIESTMRPLRPLRAMRSMRPIRPIRPIRPMRPVRPMRPMGGWSGLSWEDWSRQ